MIVFECNNYFRRQSRTQIHTPLTGTPLFFFLHVFHMLAARFMILIPCVIVSCEMTTVQSWLDRKNSQKHCWNKYSTAVISVAMVVSHNDPGTIANNFKVPFFFFLECSCYVHDCTLFRLLPLFLSIIGLPLWHGISCPWSGLIRTTNTRKSELRTDFCY